MIKYELNEETQEYELVEEQDKFDLSHIPTQEELDEYNSMESWTY